VATPRLASRPSSTSPPNGAVRLSAPLGLLGQRAHPQSAPQLTASVLRTCGRSEDESGQTGHRPGDPERPSSRSRFEGGGRVFRMHRCDLT